jgi:hypothetical protein
MTRKYWIIPAAAAFLASSYVTPVAAQTASTRAPSVASLVKLNMRIWGCVGWQIGRMETLAKYGIDIGRRCPK